MKIQLGKGKALLVLIFAVIMPFCAYSQELSNKEIREKMAEAQAFFDNKEYDNATKILTEILSSNPERLDQAVALMDKIIAIRNLYNEKYRELLDALYVEEDPEKALGLIDELYEMEPNPNEVLAQNLFEAETSVQLVQNKKTLNSQMDIAKEQLDQKDYLGALATYKSSESEGILGYKKENIQGLGERTYTSEFSAVSKEEYDIVLGIRDEIYDLAISYLSEQSVLEQQINQFGRDVSIIPSTSVLNQMNTMLDQMENLTRTRDVFLEKSLAISRNLDDLLRKTEEGKVPPERFFLDFLQFLIFGRSDTDYFEGIISATDFYWEDLFISLTDALNSAMSRSYITGVSAYGNGNLESARSSFENTRNFAIASIRAYDLLYDRITLGDNLVLDDYSTYLVGKYYGQLVDSRIYARVTASFGTMITLKDGFDRYSLADDLSVEQLYSLRQTILNDLPIIDQEEALWATIGSSLNWLESYEALPDESDSVYQLVNRELNSLREEMKGFNFAILTRLTDREYENIVNTYDDLEERYTQSLAYIEGIPDQEVIAYTGDEELLSVFPDIALPELEILFSEIGVLEDSAFNLINTFNIDETDTKDSEKIESFISNVEAKIPEIQDLSVKIDELIVLAQNNIFQADGFINRGRNLLANIDSIIANPRSGVDSFTRADEILSQASNSFLQSYGFREDLDLRREIDSTTARILEDLFQRKQKIFIDSIQKMISQAISAYRDGTYARSRNLLEQAQRMWDDIYPDEQNAQIEIWLSRVIIALQFERGRSITKNEPLYEEMMQLLNHAQNNYSQGEALIKERALEDGKLALEQAMQNLNSVKLYMPKNDTVSLLELKIEFLLDPTDTDKLRRKIDEAWGDVNSGNQSKAEDGLALLITLSKIDPDFPGLQYRIQEAKYITGQEDRPPDPQKVAESNRLTERAYQFILSGTQNETAKDLLAEALEIYPDNERAASLIYQVGADTGGPPLPRELLDKLRQAEELFAQERYLDAYKIIIELKKDPRSAKNPRVLELEELLKQELNL